jgi:hypothetical protein
VSGTVNTQLPVWPWFLNFGIQITMNKQGIYLIAISPPGLGVGLGVGGMAYGSYTLAW